LKFFVLFTAVKVPELLLLIVHDQKSPGDCVPAKLVEAALLLELLLLPQPLMMETVPAMRKTDKTEANSRDAFMIFLQVSTLISEIGTYFIMAASKVNGGM
jgi:hypothetical protein